MAHIIVTIQVEGIQLHIHTPGIMAKHDTFGGLVEKVTPLGVQESLLIAVIKASLTSSVCRSFAEAVLKIFLFALHVDSMDGGSLYCATNELTIDGLSKKYFVLVHGGGFTAWCWHKTITLLAEAGFKVTTMDVTGVSIHSFDINSITSLPQYAKPPIAFLGMLADGEKVILVGHEFDGARISFAMELFLSKVSKAEYVTVVNMQSLILFFSLREYFGMEIIDSRFATNIVHNPNLEDKVLIDSGVLL
uniref:Uncharacterized protein LOC104247003 n=1 Tax=Nicotiana sylvestris TaxID=4096 RepID=A0A1U7YAT3_NICSY|nr:PREDICTED: uncharacterized protein LOC104247003 [Nicotiana sylvestris]